MRESVYVRVRLFARDYQMYTEIGLYHRHAHTQIHRDINNTAHHITCKCQHWNCVSMRSRDVDMYCMWSRALSSSSSSRQTYFLSLFFTCIRAVCLDIHNISKVSGSKRAIENTTNTSTYLYVYMCNVYTYESIHVYWMPMTIYYGGCIFVLLTKSSDRKIGLCVCVFFLVHFERMRISISNE